MNIGKICDYLYDIGILEMNSIDDFLKYNKNISQKKFLNNSDSIVLTLSSYLEQKFNSKQSLNKLSANVINSFSDNIIINRYRSLKIIYNILISKLRMRYLLLFTKINFFIYNKYNNEIKDKFNNNIKKGKIERHTKTKKYNDINENNKINDNPEKEKISNDNRNNQRNIKLNYNYDLCQQNSPDLCEYNNDLDIDNEKENMDDKVNYMFVSDDENIINKIKKNKDTINKTNSSRKTNKLHNRFHSDFNAEEFYEKEKYNEKMREDKIKKLQYQKAMEDLNRYPFFPLINAYSKELIENKNKKQIKNYKERINSAFSSDKEIDKKKVSQNLIKKYKSITLKLQPKINIKTEIKKEKEKSKKNNEEQKNNITIQRPKKTITKEIIERIAKPTQINIIREEKRKEEEQKSLKKKNKKKKTKKINSKIKEEEKEKEHKEKEEEKEDKKDDGKEEEKVEEVKNEEKKEEEDEKEEKKEEEDKKEEKKEEVSQSYRGDIKESNISASLDMERLMNEGNMNLLEQLQNNGGLQSEALNRILNEKNK